MAAAAIYIGAPSNRRFSTFTYVALVSGCATIAAYLATVWLGGGFEVYRTATDRVMGSAFRGASILGGAPASVHFRMLLKMLTWFTVIAAVPLALYVFSRSRRRESDAERTQCRELELLCTAWIVPGFVFYATVYYLKPLYHLIYMPAIELLLATAICRLAVGRRSVSLAIASVVVALQLGFFWMGGPGLDVRLYRLTRDYVQHQDEAWEKLEQQLADRREYEIVVYVGHPDLRPHALRTIARGTPFVIRDGESLVVDDGRRVFQPDSAFFQRFRRVLNIEDHGGVGAIEPGPMLFLEADR